MKFRRESDLNSKTRLRATELKDRWNDMKKTDRREIIDYEDYRTLDRCLCCDSTDIEILLDLNNQPLNPYHKEDEVLDEYPLGVNI